MSDSKRLPGTRFARLLVAGLLAVLFVLPMIVPPAAAAAHGTATSCCAKMPTGKACCCPLPTPCRTGRSSSSETTTLPAATEAARKESSSRSGRLTPNVTSRAQTLAAGSIELRSEAVFRVAAVPSLARLRTFRI